MLHLLQLDDFGLEHLAISRGRPPKRGGRLPGEIGYALKVDYESKKLRKTAGRPRYFVSLAFQLEAQDEDKPTPVKSVQARVAGTFSFAASTPEELLKQLVPVNCLAILYGILRGIIIQATGGCAGGCFILPSLDMHCVVARSVSGAELSETVTAVTGPPAVKPRKKAKKRARRKSRA